MKMCIRDRYYSAPQGLLQKPARELSAFCKTRTLLPGESQLLTLETAKNSMASDDDLGKIFKSSYILEKGDYHFDIGTAVRDVTALDYVMTLDANLLVEQLSSKAAPASLKKRLLADGSYEELPQGTANNPNACVFEKMIPGTEEALSPATRGRASCLLLNSYKENAHPLIDVYEGKKMCIRDRSCTVSAGIFCGISVFIYVQYPFNDVHLNRGIKDSIGSADIFFCFEYYYGSLDGGRAWSGCIWCSPCNFDRTGHFCSIFIPDLFLPDAPI